MIERWSEGETGVDLVDAVMKSLKKTGWINFRMRAMVVSFFCHGLRQPWPEAAKILSRYFLDFETGIHFPQFQMQAGITGINTIRIYNPLKQEKDNDQQRRFISLWLGHRKKKIPWELLTDIKHQSFKRPALANQKGKPSQRKSLELLPLLSLVNITSRLWYNLINKPSRAFL
ncbi:MAG: FAD-binding domain-containing protein [Patescibacteria group bacterium]|nr:FAD-binding domain-containing protein [Patescibacteria group bacterium]